MRKRQARVNLQTYYKGSSYTTRETTNFSVPTEWLRNYLDGESIVDFLLEYTYDDSELIREKAKEAGVFRYEKSGESLIKDEERE